jgi:uncharacterized membrane protein
MDCSAKHEVNTMITAQTSVYTESTPERVLEFISDLNHFADLFEHIQSIDARGRGTSQVTLSTFPERHVAWYARFEKSSDGIRWESLEPSFPARGRIEVKPFRQGALVNVEFHYAPPLGLIDGAFAKLLGGRGSVLNADLERLPDLLEAQLLEAQLRGDRQQVPSQRSNLFPISAAVGSA